MKLLIVLYLIIMFIILIPNKSNSYIPEDINSEYINESIERDPQDFIDENFNDIDDREELYLPHNDSIINDGIFEDDERWHNLDQYNQNYYFDED